VEMKLISIIGSEHSQLIPVVYAYRDTISECILLYKQKHLSIVKRISHGMKQFALSHHLEWRVILLQIDDTDPHVSIDHITPHLMPTQKIWLHMSGTDPILSLLLSKQIDRLDGQITSYDYHTNKIYFLNPKSQVTCMKLTPRVTISAYIELQGYRILSQQTHVDLLPHKQSILTLYADQSRLKKLRYALLYPDQNRGFEFGFYRDLLSELEDMGIVRGHTLIPSARKLLSGDLFEMYVFWLCEELEVDDIAMGVQTDFDDESELDAHRRIVNEFDILIMHHNRLYTIECKYSTHLDGLELVYKYDAIIDYLGSHTKAILLNLSSKPKESYMQTKTSSNFHHSALRRAHRAHIAIYHETQIHKQKFQSLVRSFFELGGK